MQRTLFFSALLALLTVPASAGPLERANITKIINDVRVVEPGKGAHPAKVDETIQETLGVSTGVKSRAELMFQDQTLTRLGAETYFSFKPGTRDLDLERGTMLLQVPKGLGGARIKAAAVTAAITGTTIMMEYLPGKDVKVVVLEGSLRLSLDRRIGEVLTLTPGKMIIMKPDARALPQPISVDIKTMVKTSALIDPATFGGKGKNRVEPLPSLNLIGKAIDQQEQEKAAGTLQNTNLSVVGKGAKLTIGGDTVVAAAAVDEVSNQRDVVLPKDAAAAAKGTAVSDPFASSKGKGALAQLIDLISGKHPGPVGPNGGPAGKGPGLGGPGIPPGPGGPGGPAGPPVPPGLAGPVKGGLNILQPILVTVNNSKGDDGEDEDTKSGKIVRAADGTIHVMAPIAISASGSSKKKAGSIELTSNAKTGLGIWVDNSTEIASILAGTSPGGTVLLHTAGGTILVQNTVLRSDNGTVELRSDGPNGIVSIQGSALRADTAKIGALGDNGVILVGGGSLSADTTLKLYGGAKNGEVRFIKNVSLDGNGVKLIGANTVTIVNGVVVNVNGILPAQVYTNHPNYTGSGGNGSTTGTFGNKGAVTLPMGQRPSY